MVWSIPWRKQWERVEVWITALTTFSVSVLVSKNFLRNVWSWYLLAVYKTLPLSIFRNQLSLPSGIQIIYFNGKILNAFWISIICSESLKRPLNKQLWKSMVFFCMLRDKNNMTHKIMLYCPLLCSSICTS